MENNIGFAANWCAPRTGSIFMVTVALLDTDDNKDAFVHTLKHNQARVINNSPKESYHTPRICT